MQQPLLAAIKPHSEVENQHLLLMEQDHWLYNTLRQRFNMGCNAQNVTF